MIGCSCNEAGKQYRDNLIKHLEQEWHMYTILDRDVPITTAEIEALDLAVSIGGDGTALGLARLVGEKPILGLNSGHLGFLTDTVAYLPTMEAMFKDVFAGKYVIDKRSRLEATVISDENYLRTVTALNDIVIKGAVGKMCRLKTFVNNEYVANFPADGLIVATATGSTGYSLSAGGPIVPPELPINIITPICSHSLNARALTVSNDYIIEIEVDSFHKGVILSADGQCDIDLKTGDKIRITKAKTTTNFIRLVNEPFYSILSSKLNWKWE